MKESNRVGGPPVGDALYERSEIQGIVIGLLIGLVEGGIPLVSFPGNLSEESLAARSLVHLNARDVGRRIGLLFEEGNPRLPIVLGCIAGPNFEPSPIDPADVTIDGQKTVIRASTTLVLRCGKASIKLSNDGAIEIRGTNLISRASGRNRIFGGSIDLN